MSRLPPCLSAPSILLIDDEPDIRTVWSMLLEAEGMEVSSARDGADGLTHAQAHAPDVIVCDYMMPGMNGLEVCDAVRADKDLKGTALILWSAARGIQAGGRVDLVLEKPVDFDAFIRQIRHLLRRRTPR
ncbi:response regulator transcription factor [Caballeronia glebae]